jgi:hypothetical protein
MLSFRQPLRTLCGFSPETIYEVSFASQFDHQLSVIQAFPDKILSASNLDNVVQNLAFTNIFVNYDNTLFVNLKVGSQNASFCAIQTILSVFSSENINLIKSSFKTLCISPHFSIDISATHYYFPELLDRVSTHDTAGGRPRAHRAPHDTVSQVRITRPALHF